MDTQMMRDKFLKIAKMVGVSPETFSQIEKELSAPSATVTVVKKEISPNQSNDDTMKKYSDMTDEAIDKLSEDEAKKLIKQWRDMIGKEEGCEEEDMDEPKKPSLGDVFSKIGTMY